MATPPRTDRPADTQHNPTGAAPVAGRWRWGRLALIASLALNVAVVGIVVGAGIDRARHGPMPVQVRELNFGPFTEALDRADRDALRKAFTAEAGGGARVRRQMRQEFRGLVSALRADPYVPAATAAVFEGMRARTLERLNVGERLLLQRIDAMTAAERAQFADRVAEGLRGPKRGDGPGGRGPDGGGPEDGGREDGGPDGGGPEGNTDVPKGTAP